MKGRLAPAAPPGMPRCEAFAARKWQDCRFCQRERGGREKVALEMSLQSTRCRISYVPI